MLSEIYSIFLISSNAVACRTWPEFKSRQEKSIIQRVNGLFCTAFEATDEKLTIAPCYCSSMTLLLYSIDAQLTVIYSFIEIKINKPLQEKKNIEKTSNPRSGALTAVLPGFCRIERGNGGGWGTPVHREVRFAIFLAGGFITTIVVNQTGKMHLCAVTWL